MLSKHITESLQWFERMAKQHIVTQSIVNRYLESNNISWDILRTDLIHPICSGNKFFKLKYYLLDALQKKYTHLTTFGGAWSNHIVATAFASRFCGLTATGIIRGERPAQLSETLTTALSEGMELNFLSRKEFANKSMQTTEDAGIYTIPQGGYGIPGALGAGEMLRYAKQEDYTHLVCACGTGTMLAGLIRTYSTDLPLSADKKARIPAFLGIAVLKDQSLPQKVAFLTQSYTLPFRILHDFHFGGYAKKNEQLIDFMNDFYSKQGIPTDFVYTGKLMYAVDQLIKSGYFAPGSKILTIHSGGLQGNKSLKKGTLKY